MVVFTALVGFVTATTGSLVDAPAARGPAGTVLAAAGASVLNQVIERDTDALMPAHARPCSIRPDASARRGPRFGRGLTASGSPCCLALRAARPQRWPSPTWATYLLPTRPQAPDLARHSRRGRPGALPPVIGVGSRPRALDRSFVLFAILFLWQIPHFLAIAWLYRDDYARAGSRCCPCSTARGVHGPSGGRAQPGPAAGEPRPRRGRPRGPTPTSPAPSSWRGDDALRPRGSPAARDLVAARGCSGVPGLPAGAPSLLLAARP